jgi:uncharacterized membrane-anchored protein YitT (DUF2179 family)
MSKSKSVKKGAIDNFKEHSVGKIIFQYFSITFGLLLYTFGWSVFLIPQKIVGGGVVGVSSIIYLMSGIPVGVINFLINLILFLIGLKVLGAKFGINTIFGIIVSSLAFILFQQVIHIENFIDATQFEPFMCAVIGAGLSGAGIGIAFNNGGNSGGTDIIALIYTKFHNVSPGTVILFIDIFIIASSIIIPGSSIVNIVYGYVVMGVFSYVLDLMIEGNKQSYQIIVFSQKNDEIADVIGKEIGRGVTLLNGWGWYSKKDQKVLMVIARRTDKVDIMRVIKNIDPNAFISIAKTQGVFGANFDTLRL